MDVNNGQQMTADQLAQLRQVMPRADMSGNMVGAGQNSQPTTQPAQPAQPSGYMTPQDIAQQQMLQQQRQQAQQQAMYNQQQQAQQSTYTPPTQPQQAQQSYTPPTQQSTYTPPPTPQPQPQAQQQQQSTPHLATPNQNSAGTSAMRQRMLAAKNGQQNGQATQMQQGDNYNPNAQQPQPDPQNNAMPDQSMQGNDQIANNTIINTTDTTGDKKFKLPMSKPMALVIGGVAVVTAIGIALIVSRGTPRNEEVVDEWNESDYDWVVPDTYYSYDIAQIEELRSMGYTGEEIENAQAQQIPAADLIRQARAARNAYVQMTLAPMYDTASYEYKEFIEQTWLTLPERDDMYEWQNLASYYDVRKNLDYEKVDVYGSQLFIKVYLDDNYHEDWFFCLVTPEEWARLDDYGNIVVNYTYCTRFDGDDLWTAEEDFENIYIIKASIEFTN